MIPLQHRPCFSNEKHPDIVYSFDSNRYEECNLSFLAKYDIYIKIIYTFPCCVLRIWYGILYSKLLSKVKDDELISNRYVKDRIELSVECPLQGDLLFVFSRVEGFTLLDLTLTRFHVMSNIPLFSWQSVFELINQASFFPVSC